MKRNPLYVFKDLDSKGIYDVPVESTIQLNDIDPDNNILAPRILQIIDKSGFFPQMTIGQMITDFPNGFIDLTTSTEIPSELEKIKNTSGDYAWRILGRDKTQYADPGTGSFDFSKVGNFIDPISPYGAKGDYAFAAGYRTQATGAYSHAEGFNTTALGSYSQSWGSWNIGKPDSILEIGIGTSQYDKRNAFEINNQGVVLAPEMTIQEINTAGITALVTKEYMDYTTDNKYDKIGGIISGDVTINGTNPGTIPSLINKGISTFEKVAIFKEGVLTKLNGITSDLLFEDTSLILPKIAWDSSLKDFFIDTDILQAQKLWHAGSDGIDSGLDADLLRGIPGDQYATLVYTDNGLDNKYDKLGGIISGDVTIFGDLDVSQVSTLNSLKVTQTTETTGLLTATGNIQIDSDLYVTGNTYIPTINSDIVFTNNTIFNSLNTFNGETTINNKILIKPTVNRNSLIYFEDYNQTTPLPTFYWNSDQDDFYMMGLDQIGNRIWHDGNMPASSVVHNFDDLSDTPAAKVAGSFPKVNTTATGFDYYNIDQDLIDANTNAVWGNITGSLNNQIDLSIALDSKYNAGGGTIAGNVTVTGNTVVYTNLPTTDPGQPGQLWDNAGVLSISQ